MNYLHPLVSYAFLGVLLGTVLASTVVKFRSTITPEVKEQIWFVPLLVPFVFYAISWAWRWRITCWTWWVPGQGTVPALLSWLCRAGAGLAHILAPLLAIALVVGISKAVAAVWLGERLWRRFGKASNDERVTGLVATLAASMSIKPPRVVVTSHPFSEAFVTGIVRPVIVVSRRLVAHLDDEELAAVLAHELAHIEVGDHWKKWLGIMLRDMLFFTGLSFVVYRNLQGETEARADARAAEVTGRPLALAAALIKGWKSRSGQGRRHVLLDDFTPLLIRGNVEWRVERLLKRLPVPASTTGQGWRLAFLRGVVWVLTGVVLLASC